MESSLSLDTTPPSIVPDRFVDAETLRLAITNLVGSAGHLLKIWLVLKKMGLDSSHSVSLDTGNSTDSLQRLFGCGAPDGRFFVPFASTPRFMEMKSDASRSIIQTNANRWAESGSVVTCNPTGFLEFKSNDDGTIRVRETRQYPNGLGYGSNGFASSDEESLHVPLAAFAIWYGRVTPIPAEQEPLEFLVQNLRSELGLEQDEVSLVFDSNFEMEIGSRLTALTDEEIYAITRTFLEGKGERQVKIFVESKIYYLKRVNRMSGNTSVPNWLKVGGQELFEEILAGGATAILLFGPPRTGKTYAIDDLIPRNSEERVTIQIHDGWGYQDLVMGYRPQSDGTWAWKSGPLLEAIRGGKKFIVLEEINRTLISEALGEIFSLIESNYRGEKNLITMPDGSSFFMPEETVLIATMNNVDKSTEDLDDALLGRMACIEFRPDAKMLMTLLTSRNVKSALVEPLIEAFIAVNVIYPLGHAYFAGLSETSTERDVLRLYSTRIRPVLVLSLGEFHRDEIVQLDNEFDQLFSE